MQGLTKLEYFTAMAMQGLLSNPEWMKAYEKEKYLMKADVVADVAVKYGKACLEELENK